MDDEYRMCGVPEKCLSLQSEVAHQCVVRLPLETILRECRDIVATAKFERLVEELYDEDPGEAMGICALFDAKR